MPLRRRRPEVPPRRPRYVVDLQITDGSELVGCLRQQGLAPDEIVFKYLWPRYAPPPGSGIRALYKTESLSAQFERIVAMHRIVPSGIPLPVGIVRNPDGELVGYVIEYVEGETLLTLIERRSFDEAARQLAVVERTVAKLHAKQIAHGDLTAANVIAADDGRTVLIDPVANASPGTLLQDSLSLDELRALVEPD